MRTRCSGTLLRERVEHALDDACGYPVVSMTTLCSSRDLLPYRQSRAAATVDGVPAAAPRRRTVEGEPACLGKAEIHSGT